MSSGPTPSWRRTSSRRRSRRRATTSRSRRSRRPPPWHRPRPSPRPATHASYYGQLKDKVDLIGPNVTGAKIGWAVPKYSQLASIEDLKSKASVVEGKVIGIDPGAGLMKASDKVIKEYGLPVKLIDGSDATMTAALKDAYDRKQDIVVTTWTPHWMFARWELKYLDDPKKVFGGEESVNTVARKDLKKDMPEVHAILSK